MSNTITFNIKHEDDKIKAIKLDQLSKDKLNERDQERFEDLGTGLINGILASFDESTRSILKHTELPVFVQNYHFIKLNTITLGMDYVMYLADEREKFGDNGLRDHVIATSQPIVGWVFSGAGAAGGALVGNIPGGISGAVSASIIYDVKNIGGKPASEWIGDAARTIYDRYH